MLTRDKMVLFAEPSEAFVGCKCALSSALLVVCSSVCLSVCLSVRPSVCLSAYDPRGYSLIHFGEHFDCLKTDRKRQVRQQNAYRANAGVQLKLLCITPSPFSRATAPSLIVRVAYSKLLIQEALLLQRDRATLRVIKYFAKTLKVIRNDTVK